VAQATMTRAELEAFVNRHHASMARQDPVALAADHAAEGVIVSPMFATVRGRAAIEGSYRALFTSFPDWEITPDAIVVDPPRVAVLGTAHATHVNDFFGHPGTNRKIEIPLVRYMTFENGGIMEERRIYDFTGLLVQIGVLRAKPARP
jgi:predicted ester cyclase